MRKFKLVDSKTAEKLQAHSTKEPQRISDQVQVYTPPQYPKYKTPDPQLFNLGQLDGKMKQIIDSDDMDIYTKINKYNDVLEDYLNYYNLYKGNTYREQIDAENIKLKAAKQVPLNIQNALANVPKTLRQKAQSIIDTIKESDVLSWDESGHLLYKGNLVPNSNIADIINDSLKYRKTAKRPAGWESFARGAQEINIPRTLIGNPVYFDTYQDGDDPDQYHSIDTDIDSSIEGAASLPIHSRSRSKTRRTARRRPRRLKSDYSSSSESKIAWSRSPYI